jgi:hypothetical protein
MRLFLAAAFLTGSVLPAFADYGQTITPTQALSNIGLCMTVEGRATVMPAVGRLGMQLVLDDGNSKLVGYVDGPSSIPDLQSLDGQTVNLTGVIQMDYGLPEIELNSPDYVWVAGNAPDTLVTCWASG